MKALFLYPDWPAPSRVKALTTLRYGAGYSAPPFDSFNLGARCGDDPRVVTANRARLVELAQLPAPPCWLSQVHGTEVVRFQHPCVTPLESNGDFPQADAAVTSVNGVVLAILTADCLPVLFCADDGSEIGAAHAGWRGLAEGILTRTLAMLRTPPKRLWAWLGPAAGPQAYEVGVEVREAFTARRPGYASAFAATRPGHWHCDLYVLARQQLREAGVANIFGGDRCTISEPENFFSHRRDGVTGRMATLIWLRPAPL